MYCSQCGKELSKDSEFCGYCGMTVPAAAAKASQGGQPPAPPGPPAAAQPPPSTGTTPAAPPAGPQAGPPAQPGPYTPPPKKSVLPWVLGGIGLVAIIAVVLVLVFVVFGGGESDTSGPEQVAESFYEAIEKKDADMFLATMEPSFRSELRDALGENYEQFFEFFFEAFPEDLEVTIRKMDTEINGNEAVVTVVDGTMTYTDEYGDKVSEEASESELASVFLERVDGKWYMSSDALKEAGLDPSRFEVFKDLESSEDLEDTGIEEEYTDTLFEEVIPPIDSVDEAVSALLEVQEIWDWYWPSYDHIYEVAEESSRYVFYLYELAPDGTEIPYEWYEVDKETGDVFAITNE